MHIHPLEQFEIHPLISFHIGKLDLSFSNASLFMLLAALLPVVVLRIALSRESVIPGRFQALAELPLSFIHGMLADINGEEGKRFLPFMFSVFMFVFMGNMLGMIPYCFTFTSHVVANFALGALVLGAITVIGLIKNGLGFLHVFFPSGLPAWVAPLLIPVELVSYFARPLSLAIRLFANMTAGHIMMKIFAYLTVGSGIAGIAPLMLNVALTGFEVFIAFLQAYVFTILSCIYLNDALHGH